MAVLKDDYLVAGQPDGFTGQNVVRSRLFRQTVVNFGTANAGDALAQNVNYAVAKFPAGFVPRSIVANVISPNATAAAVTLNVAKNATDLASATVAAANSGTDGSVFAAGTAGQTLVVVSAPWVTGENDYLVLTPAAAVDAKFEVVVVGDWPELAGVAHLPKLA